MAISIKDLLAVTKSGGVLKLPAGEYVENIVIDRPVIIEGTGRSTWIGARVGPVIQIKSPHVTLRDLMVESLVPSGTAIDAIPGTDPILERVDLTGEVLGVFKASITPSSSKIHLPPPSALEFGREAEQGTAPLPSSLSARVQRKLDALLDEAEDNEQQGNYEAAVDAYDRALTLSGDSLDIVRLRAVAASRIAQTPSDDAIQQTIPAEPEGPFQLYSRYSEFPLEELDEYWSSDYSPAHVAWGDDEWILVALRDPEGDLACECYTSPTFPDEVIEEKWEEGLSVSELTYGDDQWIFLFDRNPGDQEYFTENSFPKEAIHKAWSNGNRVVCAGASDTQWVIVVAPGDYPQRYIQTNSPLSEILTAEKLGLHVEHAFFAEGFWVLFFRGNPTPVEKKKAPFDPFDLVGNVLSLADAIFSPPKAQPQPQSQPIDQLAFLSETFPEEEISTYGEDGYIINSAAYGNGEWLVTLMRFSGPE